MLYVKRKKYTIYCILMEIQLEETKKRIYKPTAALSIDGFRGKQIPEFWSVGVWEYWNNG